MKNSKLILASVLVSLCQFSYGQAKDSLIDLSLEDLMKITVTTASKSSEKIQDAPAVVTLVTAKEIESFGANSLTEILDRLTSVYVTSTYFAPEGMIAMRGSQTEHYNTKVLILLDGRPLRESLHGGWNGAIYSMFPIERIERIEVIRGPGSVLYGTGAYIGVINIVTKKGSSDGFVAKARFGSFNTKQGNLSYAKTFNKFDFSGGLNFFKTDGWNFTARGESDVVRNKANTADSVFKTPQTIYRDNNGVAGVLKFGYKGLTVNLFGAGNDWATMGRLPNWASSIEYRIANSRYFGDLSYSHRISEVWSTSLSATYNYMNYRAYNSSKADDYLRRGSSDVLFEFTNNIKPMPNLNIVVGGLANIQNGKAIDTGFKADGTAANIDTQSNTDPWLTVPQYNYTWYAGYVQADYTPIKNVKFISGAQLNKINGLSANISPRVGMILSANDNLGVKVLYGSAFRSPSAFERFGLSPNSVTGSVDLTPEKITTIEAQVFYNTAKMNLAATYFHNHDANNIQRINLTQVINGVNFTQQYVNTGFVDTQGIELEGKYKIESFNLMGSFTYQSSIDDQDRSNYSGLPPVMGKLGLVFNYKGVGSVSLFNSYFGKPADYFLYNTQGDQLTKMANTGVQAYTYSSANLVCNLKELIGSGSRFPNLVLNVYVNNLFDQEAYYPELVRRNINSLPGRQGRAIYAGLVFKL